MYVSLIKYNKGAPSVFSGRHNSAMSSSREKRCAEGKVRKVKRAARNPEVTSRCRWRRLSLGRRLRVRRRMFPVWRRGEARCGREGSDEEEAGLR